MMATVALILEKEPTIEDNTISKEQLYKHMENVTKNAFDIQIGGNHYKDHAIQPLAFIEANNLSFAEGCVIKYLLRHKQKGGVEDLKKARHYIDLIIATQYGSKA